MQQSPDKNCMYILIQISYAINSSPFENNLFNSNFNLIDTLRNPRIFIFPVILSILLFHRKFAKKSAFLQFNVRPFNMSYISGFFCKFGGNFFKNNFQDFSVTGNYRKSPGSYFQEIFRRLTEKFRNVTEFLLIDGCCTIKMQVFWNFFCKITGSSELREL